MRGQDMMPFILVLLWLTAGMAGNIVARYRAGVTNVVHGAGSRAWFRVVGGGAAAARVSTDHWLE
jgi:hypothetical protein